MRVPSTTPGARPIVTGRTRRHTRGSAARLVQITYAFSATSSTTSAGLSARLLRNSSASGTVIDEKPYPSAPLTSAAPSVIRTSAAPWFAINTSASRRAEGRAPAVPGDRAAAALPGQHGRQDELRCDGGGRPPEHAEQHLRFSRGARGGRVHVSSKQTDWKTDRSGRPISSGREWGGARTKGASQLLLPAPYRRIDTRSMRCSCDNKSDERTCQRKILSTVTPPIVKSPSLQT